MVQATLMVISAFDVANQSAGGYSVSMQRAGLSDHYLADQEREYIAQQAVFCVLIADCDADSTRSSQVP